MPFPVQCIVIGTHFCRFVRENGGVCIADEVQSAFGRCGEYFWGFQTQSKCCVCSFAHSSYSFVFDFVCVYVGGGGGGGERLVCTVQSSMPIRNIRREKQALIHFTTHMLTHHANCPLFVR